VTSLLWLAHTYLLCLASFIAGVVITALVLRKKRAAAGPQLDDPQLQEPEADGAETGEPVAMEPADEEPAPRELGPRESGPVESGPVESGPVKSAGQEPDADEPAAEVPASTIVKATKKSMRYHTPDSPYYNRIKGDVVFTSVEDAEAAGYTAWKTPARA
jgi:hypothetical protein